MILTGDGDTDIVITNNNGPVELLINSTADTQSASSSLVLALRGEAPNLNGVGAKVALLQGDEAIHWRTVRTDGSYLSANSPKVHFGLTDDRGVTGVGVVWTSGLKEKWPLAGLENKIIEGSGAVWSTDL